MNPGCGRAATALGTPRKGKLKVSTFHLPTPSQRQILFKMFLMLFCLFSLLFNNMPGFDSANIGVNNQWCLH